MAFMKYAYARVVHPNVTKTEWKNVRLASRKEAQSTQADLSGNLIDRASELFGEPFDPKQYLLSHVTIIASVDTYSPPGVKTGSVVENGFKVNRKFSDFRVKPSSDPYLNNNLDGWSRQVLLKAFPTFVGGHNFVEHVQVEELSKGRIIDAVARDIGDSVYVDILIATDRKHKDLIKSIESGKMGTLSMGCFLSGTQVTMADGRRIAIEDVQPGDMVLTHKGRAREVLNKQIRGGKWGIRRIQAVGVPNTIEATDNHPFFVFRRPDVCACGCEEALSAYKNAARELGRRFKHGHDKRILNPNGVYSIQEYQERKAQKEDIQKNVEGQWVRADELRVGDFVCFPRATDENVTSIGEGKARLLGYFLADGSFLKHEGERVEVQFNFGLSERNTFAQEVFELLRQEFPEANSPWVQERPDRNTCTVHCTGREMVSWFYQHGGEYGNHKRLSPEVLAWPVEAHKHLIGSWIDGDGCQGVQGSLSGATTSYDLACQMHMLMFRCGWFARMEARVGTRSVEIRDIVNGGFIRDEVSGRLPSFDLVIGKTQAVNMCDYTSKAPKSTAFKSQWPRVRDDVVMFPITSIEESSYDGWVHNMEVAEDNSYIVEGVTTHNCSVDATQCTKCGNWAADETEMCPCIKYSKGNTFFDENGKQHRVAELCGHASIDPTGGVQFIEASWVETPAFTGAVLRNVLDFDDATVKKAKKVLASPSPEWSSDSMVRAASVNSDSLMSKKFFTPARTGVLVGANVDDVFLAGWMDEEGGGDPASPDGGAPADPVAPSVPKDPFQDVEDEAYNYIKDRVLNRFKRDMTPADSVASPASTNETLNKQASLARKAYVAGLNDIVRTSPSDVVMIDRVAAFNRHVGITIPIELYRASLKIGSTDRYRNVDSFTQTCGQVLGHRPTTSEIRTLVRLGQLLSRRKSAGAGS